LCQFGAQFGFQSHPNVEVVAVTDLIPARRAQLAKACGCEKTYDDGWLPFDVVALLVLFERLDGFLQLLIRDDDAHGAFDSSETITTEGGIVEYFGVDTFVL